MARSTRLNGEVILASSGLACTTGFIVLVAGDTRTGAALASFARTEPVHGVVASVEPPLR
ncbi:MAG: hypothetical protein JO290_05320 [Sphingomonadaceae bacterium]|nr:hypothetical protein [Sphingomonadaceae bacterium]